MKLPKNFGKKIDEMTDKELIEFAENEIKEWRKMINIIKKDKKKRMIDKERRKRKRKEKYSLTTNTKKLGNLTLYQIKAEEDFNDVKKGDLGGWIESEKNLSQNGNAWVYNDAQIFGDAQIFEDAQIFGDTWISGDTKISGNAWISGDAIIQ